MNTHAPPDKPGPLTLAALEASAESRQREIRHLAARLIAGNADAAQMRAAGLALLQLSGQDNQAGGL